MTAKRKSSYSYEELLQSSRGELFGKGNAQLPAPPMLMFDRITEINDDGGKYCKGEVIAELDIKPDLWFFNCHFEGDPVMPGCLGLDAMLQLLGFFIGWAGVPGKGRALGSKEVKFTDQVIPGAELVTYQVHVKRLILRKLAMGVADALMKVDGREIYSAKDLRVGLFESIV